MGSAVNTAAPTSRQLASRMARDVAYFGRSCCSRGSVSGEEGRTPRRA